MEFRQRKILLRLATAVLALSAMGSHCDGLQSVNQASLSCNPNIVEVSLHDTYLQKVCGCGGTNGESVIRGSAMSCTFQLGKVIFVNFAGAGAGVRHQLIPVGSPAIPYSNTYDPADSKAVRTFTFKPESVGTYQFRDNYDEKIFGSFTVTP